jgi:acyl-CoA thioesterase FadM
VRTRLAGVSPAKIEHEYELLRGDEILATARVTLALVDRAGTVQPVPDWLQDLG